MGIQHVLAMFGSTVLGKLYSCQFIVLHAHILMILYSASHDGF